MVRFIKAVDACDKILDCLPIVSTLKNLSLYLYRLAHKTNNVANPVKTTWKEDIKIHILTKDSLPLAVSMFPVVGNLLVLGYHLANAVIKAFGIGKGNGYLMKATRAHSSCLKKHGHEVVALCLAEKPNRSKKKLSSALWSAAYLGKVDVLKLILNSRSEWSSETLSKLIVPSENKEVVEAILEKHSKFMNINDVGSVIVDLSKAPHKNFGKMELLLKTYQNIDEVHIGRALMNASREEKGTQTLNLLLDHYPQIREDFKTEAMKLASKKSKDSLIAILTKWPELKTRENMGLVLEEAAFSGKEEIVDWLLNNNEDISEESIGKAMANATSVYYGENDPQFNILFKLKLKYKKLPVQYLILFLDTAANSNAAIFKIILDEFDQIKSEHVQEILNNAVYSSRNPTLVQVIKSKFPEMKAEDPHAKYR